MRQVETAGVAQAAAVCAAALAAQQVAGKATRDALFLSTFDVATLPAMMTAAAAASLLVTLALAPVLSAGGPAPFLVRALVVSVVLQAAATALVHRAPRATAVGFYLYVATVGPVLASAFWSAVTERFDPRSAKRWVGRVAAGGTLGGLAGGVMAERVAAGYGPVGVLALLAALHALCAWRFRAFAVMADPVAAVEVVDGERPGPRSILGDRYLRTMALLVVFTSAAGTLADYAFKREAFATIGGGAPLLRFFALFYTACGVVAFGTQVLLSRRSLEKLGLARTASILPLALAGGGIVGAAAPAFAVVAGLRAADNVLRTSLHRLAYELLYAPVAPRARRAAKAVIDVGSDRAGEIAAAGLLALPLLAAATPAALIGVSVFGFLALGTARLLHGGYIRALERSLVSRAFPMDATAVMDPATRQVIETLTSAPPSDAAATALMPAIPGAADGFETGLLLLEWSRPGASVARTSDRAPRPAATAVGGAARDPVSGRWADLRSAEAERVKAALTAGPLDALLVPAAVRLLGWDDVAETAEAALRPVAGSAVGQLVDSLLDSGQEFAIRRRLPSVIAADASARAVDGLGRGLHDTRFEVRLECAKALAALRTADPGLTILPPVVLDAVRRETAVSRDLWDGRRGNRSLEHVFTLLSLMLPPKAIRLTFLAVTGADPHFRGIALEYLESILPEDVGRALWPFLDESGATTSPADGERRPPDSVLADLLRSDPSVRGTVEGPPR